MPEVSEFPKQSELPLKEDTADFLSEIESLASRVRATVEQVTDSPFKSVSGPAVDTPAADTMAKGARGGSLPLTAWELKLHLKAPLARIHMALGVLLRDGSIQVTPHGLSYRVSLISSPKPDPSSQPSTAACGCES